MALTAGELYAAFADDGVVGFGESFGEFIDAGGAASEEELFFSGVRPREHDVVADGAVEEERILEDDAELGAIAVEVDGGEVLAIDEDAPVDWIVEGADEADDG